MSTNPPRPDADISIADDTSFIRGRFWARAALAGGLLLLLLACEGPTGPPIPPAPTLASLSPTAGARATTVSVTLTGTDLSFPLSLSLSGTGITVAEMSSTADGTTLAADFIIAADAPLGDREVSVRTRGGTSAPQTFTVLLAAPTLATVEPSAGVRGTTTAVTLTGTDFVTGATTVAVSGSGIAVSNVNVSSATTLTADFVIDGDAAIGDRTVAVATASGSSGGLTFTVNPPTPALSDVSPAAGVQGTTVAVTLTGTTFVDGGTTVAVSGSGVTVSDVSVTSTTSLTADFVIENDAALGERDVTVTTVGGASGTLTFTVNPPAVTLTGISPAIGVRGTTVAVTLTGTNFVAGATTVAVSGSNVTVSNVDVVSATSLTADFAVGSSAALGSRTVTVTTAGGTSGTQSFTINPPAPTLTSVGPVTGVQGNAVSVTLTGTNFVAGATVAVSGTGVTVSNVTVASGTSITATFTLASSATLGARNVTVTTSGGTTAAQTFTVNPPAPTLTSVSPPSGTQGTTVVVTLTGTNFVAGATVAVSGTGVTVSNVTVVSGTSITATFTIASDATTGGRNVTVATAGGTSGAQTFTVNAAGEPQEIPITP